ncbi:MAG: hypothetical protein CML04_11450 [Pseudozobellia sp.]|nr:hypothetical protein [Pseudozobellia sp.]MBG50385.1 hypothetical protein [Pseudozobellia sp.]|tara:strand:+ start:2043 stop:2699 length:657 start_codon:yes stop_codon:yes gene_type:complete
MDIKIDSRTVIVFDLDDTLYNELSYLKSAYIEIAQSLSPKNWQSLYSRMLSLYRDQKNVFLYLSENWPIEKAKLIESYRNHFPNITLFEGARQLLTDIKAKDGKLALITDGRSLTQRNKLKALQIEDLFDKVIISEEIGSEKPNINNYLAIERQFPNSSYCYIADNLKKDFIVPNERGWNSIGLIDNGMNIHFTSHQYLNDSSSPKGFIVSLKEITIA